MSQEPLLSVCLITYNHEKYVREALDGIFMQEVDFPMEIIVADDCSTDNTRAIIMEYYEKHSDIMRLVFQEKNVGPAQNWLDLMNAPKGKYIAYLEGDDYWTDPLKSQKQVDFLEANRDYAIVSGKAKILEENYIKRTIGDSLEKQTYEFQDFVTHNNLISCTVMFINTNIESKYYKKVYFGDWMLYCNILNENKNKKAMVINDIFAHYRVHQNGVMSKLSSIGTIEKHILQIKEIHKFFKLPFSEKDKKAIKNDTLELYIYYLKNNENKKAFEIAKTSFSLLQSHTPLRKFASYYRYRNKLS